MIFIAGLAEEITTLEQLLHTGSSHVRERQKNIAHFTLPWRRLVRDTIPGSDSSGNRRRLHHPVYWKNPECIPSSRSPIVWDEQSARPGLSHPRFRWNPPAEFAFLNTVELSFPSSRPLTIGTIRNSLRMKKGEHSANPLSQRWFDFFEKLSSSKIP